MTDIITTVVMGEHVCFVDRICNYFTTKIYQFSLVCCEIDVGYFTDVEPGCSMEWKMMVL
jgi:hypothetical protein